MIRGTAKRLIGQVTANDYQPLNRIELSRQNLLDNVALFQAQHPEQTIIPVLKGNAYGHGLLQIAEILQMTSLPILAVDGYFEAAQIRDIVKQKILVMGYINPANTHLLDTKKCSFVVQDIAGLHAFGALDKPVRIHMEINTGMHRLGLQPREIAEYLKVLKQYPKLQLEGIMSHLADADNDSSDDFTDMQVIAFDRAVKRILAQGFTPKYIHLAQTAGSTKAHSKYANALRLGIGLYGISPLSRYDHGAPDLADLKPALSLQSTIIKTYNLKKGDRVSYNGIFEASGPMRIGVLPLGYYEGVPRELSNTGLVTAGEHSLPIVGRVCMNHTMIDISATKLEVGDEVTVINNDIDQPNSIQSVAATHDIFSYGWLANLSGTIRRIVV